jgi:hypothetical protein
MQDSQWAVHSSFCTVLGLRSLDSRSLPPPLGRRRTCLLRRGIGVVYTLQVENRALIPSRLVRFTFLTHSNPPLRLRC